MLFRKIKEDLLPILSTKKSIGLMISGGLDSSLLLYICCLIKKQENLLCEFVAFTVPKKDNSLEHSQRVLNWITTRFEEPIKTNYVGNLSLPNPYVVWSGALEAKKKVDQVLIGDTANPPHFTNGPNRIRVRNPLIYQPFLLYTKKDIVSLIIELSADDLMELTHTCVRSPQYRCNECWWCRERAWGFKEKNYIDLGRM